MYFCSAHVHQLTSIQAAVGLMHISGMTHVMMSPKTVLPRRPDCWSCSCHTTASWVQSA